MKLNRYIDHTLLRPEATEDDVTALCREAKQYEFYSVVINPVYISLAVRLLKNSAVKIGSVAGFPLGANRTETKISEALAAEHDGADEIDVVANIGWIEAGRFSGVTGELAAIKRKLNPETVLKVIIETPLIRPEHWCNAVEAVIDSGADFVKSATGFFGTTPVEHIIGLSKFTGGRIKVKAAGGIKTADDALAMIDAGADRIGSSSSVSIMRDYARRDKK